MSLAERLAQRQAPPAPARDRSTTSGVSRTTGPLAEIRRRVHRELQEVLGPKLYAERSASVLEQRVRETLHDALGKEETPLTAADRTRITAEICDEILGHGPLEPLLRDPDVSEIMVNGPERIYVERFGRILPVDAAFVDEEHLRRIIDKIVARVGRRVDESSPMVDARLPDGSRVNAVLPPIALDGAVLTIRKFAADPYNVDDLVAFGTLTKQVAHFLAACVRGRLDMLITGGTGTGKTTTLNVLSQFLPADERIVTIEDAAELQLHQEHVLRLESRPANIEGRGQVTVRDLVRNALRMRPDRIVVGEVRDGAALDMLQAMNTGHDGSLTTVHANSPRDSLARIETMVLMAGVDLPVRAIREQASSAIDLILHQSRLSDGSRRITHVTEVLGLVGDVITLQDIYQFDFKAGVDSYGRFRGSLKPTGIRPALLDRLADSGITVAADTFAVDTLMLYVFAGFFFVAIALAALALAWPRTAEYHRMKRIAEQSLARLRGPDEKARPAAGAVERAAEPDADAGGRDERTADAAVRRRRIPASVARRAAVAAVTAVVLWILAGWLGGLMGLALGWLVTVFYQTVRVDRRSHRFAELLPDALQLVIGSLKSGFSLQHALDALVRESDDPVAAEFGRAMTEHRLGADLSDALEGVARRAQSDDLSWTVMAVRIQREVGGNLAEVLQTTVDTMRERDQLRRHVRSLSAEGRLSALVLIALPIVLSLFMFSYRRDYMAPLFTDPFGLTMLIGGSLLFVTGTFWMTRVIKVEP